MFIKEIKDEDFVNYRQPSMFIGMGRCNFKCCTDAGVEPTVCQNYALHSAPDIEVDAHELVDRYYANPIVEAVVLGGLDPMDDWDSVCEFLTALRERGDDTVVIYTGYTAYELRDRIPDLQKFGEIIMKFGRYNPYMRPRYDPTLGVELASANQLALWIDEVVIDEGPV